MLHEVLNSVPTWTRFALKELTFVRNHKHDLVSSPFVVKLSQGSGEERSEVKHSANSFHITSGLLMTPFSSLQTSFLLHLLISRSGHCSKGCFAPTFQGHGLEHFFCIITPIILALRKGSPKYNVLNELLIIMLELTNNRWTVFKIRTYLWVNFEWCAA